KEEENNFRADLFYQLLKSLDLNVGGTIKLIEFDADILFPTFYTTFGDSLPVTSLTKSENFIKLGSYINLNIAPIERLTTNFGLRLDYFDALAADTYLSPRLSVSYRLTDITNINISSGIYYQS